MPLPLWHMHGLQPDVMPGLPRGARLVWDGEHWVAGGDGQVYKTADQSLSTTALTNDSELSIGLDAGCTYKVKGAMFVQTAGAVEGVKVAFGGTVTLNNIIAQVCIYDNATAAGVLAKAGLITSGAQAIGVVLPIGSSFIQIDGTVEVNTAGMARLRWAQQAGVGAAATTVRRGSFFSVEKIL